MKIRRSALMLVGLAGLVLMSTGCGYAKNVRDDFMDIGTFAVGVTPPVLPVEAEQVALGFLPPCVGVYGEFTNFLHLGALLKASADCTWDRRGCGIIFDRRVKYGIGPWHRAYIDEIPINANDYKIEDSELSYWREHMLNLRDPIFGASAKRMIFQTEEVDGEAVPQPWMARGWQDWETISVEIAIPEPFITHSGLYVRAGIDPSQIFDFLLGLLTIDLYGDRAYNLDGTTRFGPIEAVLEEL